MADRMTLHMNHLAEFSAWLELNGYVIEATIGIYEALRAKKTIGGKDTVVVYKKNRASQHLSVMDKDMHLVRKFLRDRKERAS